MKRNCFPRRTAFAALALAVALSVPTLAFAAEDATIIDIFHVNDVHARVDNYPAIGGFVDAAKAQNKNTLLLDAGDTLHGQTIATLEEGESIVHILNAVGFDVMTPGNHDFNYGAQKLLSLKEQMQFPLVSCNVYQDGKHFLPSYQIFDLEGASIAVIGVTTPSTAYSTHPDNVKGLEFRDPVDELKKAVAEISDKVDAVIVLAHVGLDPSSDVTTSKIAQEVPGIDLIIDGHSHTKLQDGIQVGNTLIASTGEYAENLGHVTIKIDGDSKQLSAELFDMSAVNTTDSSADDYIQPKASVQKLIDDTKESQKSILAEVVGKTPALLDGDRAHVRSEATNLSDLITDIILKESGAQVALHNGGNIRASIPAGEITRGDVIEVLPFGNYIVTKTVTGAELAAALEHGFTNYYTGGGGFPQFAGIKATFDAAASAGERLQEVTVGGAPLVMDEEYLLATNDFLAAGGDNYTMFENLPVQGEFSALDEVVIKHIQAGFPIPEQADNRLTVLNAATDSAAEPAPAPVQETPTAPSDLQAPETLPAPIPEVPAPAPEATPSANADTYTVQPGDYLASIAEQFGLTWRELYDLNRDRIQNPNFIYVGQELRVKKAA